MNKLILFLSMLLGSSTFLWSQLTVQITDSTDPSCHGYADGTATVSISGGTEPYDLLWDDDSSSTGLSVTGLAASRYYRVTVTDATMATEKDSVILSQPAGVSIILDSVRNNPCLGWQEAAIYISASGGSLPYVYDWSGPGAYADVTEDIEDLGEGMFNLDLTDGDGCITNFQQAIVDEDPISVSYTLSAYEAYNLECYGDNSGSIKIDTVTGNGLDWRNFTYIWNGPGGFKSYVYEIDSLQAGNYHLNVFDSVNCRSDISITLTAPNPIFVNYDSVLNNPCLNTADGAIYITPSGGELPFQFSWTGPEEFSSSEEDLQNLAKGRYHLLISDAEGCSSESDTNLILSSGIEMVIETSLYGDYNIQCFGLSDGSIKIREVTGFGDISSFYFYTTGPDGFSSLFRFMDNLAAGSYHINVTDSLGCNGEEDIVLSQPPKVETAEIEGSETFYEDTNYVYSVNDVSTGSTYNWSVDGGEIWSGQGTTSVEVEWRIYGTGTLSVVEADENGCLGDPVNFEANFLYVSDQEVKTPSVRIYPIPTEGLLHIRGLENITGKIEIYTILGQMVSRHDMQSSLNLESLEKGIYYMRIRDQQGKEIDTRRIVKK
jgi:hypothetical protein